jgi:hypothetical protein
VRVSTILLKRLRGRRVGRSPGTADTLFQSQPLRSTQRKIHAYAMKHAALLRELLKNSSDDRQRIPAAHMLGYAQHSKSQITALVHGSHDC